MFDATVLTGAEFTYTGKKDGQIHSGYQFWFTIAGVPYSFKMTVFSPDQIEKAKAAVISKKVKLDLVPDNNTAPRFILA